MTRILLSAAVLACLLAAAPRAARADDDEDAPPEAVPFSQIRSGGNSVSGAGVRSGGVDKGAAPAASPTPSDGGSSGGGFGGAASSLETPPDNPCSDYTAPAPDPKAPKLKLKPGQDLDLSQATIVDAPAGLADWPETTRITRLDMTSDGISAEFSKRDGDGSWPDETITFGPTGPLQYSLGMAEYIDGRWYASAPVQLWRGLDKSGGGPADYAKNWFYGSWWGPMRCRQPRVGETIGIFVAAGSLRHVTDSGSQSPVKERSNVILVRMPAAGGASYTFP